MKPMFHIPDNNPLNSSGYYCMCTTRPNSKKFYFLSTEFVLYGSQNKQ